MFEIGVAVWQAVIEDIVPKLIPIKVFTPPADIKLVIEGFAPVEHSIESLDRFRRRFCETSAARRYGDQIAAFRRPN
jgi:hypothetical protein